MVPWYIHNKYYYDVCHDGEFVIFLYNSWTVDAFDGAVKAGNDEIVNYFLHNFHGVIDETRKVEHCP